MAATCSPARPLLPPSVRRHAAIGAVGALAVAVGGALAGGAAAPGPGDPWLWQVPAIPVRPVVDLLPALVLFYAGLVLLTRGWIGLRRAIGALDGSAVRRRQVVLVVCALWAVPLVLGPPLGSRDVYAYAAVGELADSGLDPYEVGPSALGDVPLLDAVDPVWRESPTPYGPAFLALARGAAGAVGGHVFTAVLLYRALALLGLALVAWFLPRLADAFGGDPALALVLVLGNPLTLLHLVSGAHNEALLVGLVVAGLAIGGGAGRPAGSDPIEGPRRRGTSPLASAGFLERVPMAAYVLGLVLCSLAAGIKVPAVLAVVWLAWNRPGRHASVRARATSVAVAGALTLVVLGLTAEVSGYGWGWAGSLGTATKVTAYLSPTVALGHAAEVAGRALGLGWDGGEVARAVQLLGVALAAAVATGVLARSHRSGLKALGITFVAVALLLPAVHPWYLVWGLVLLAAVVTSERARSYVVLSVVMAFGVLPGGPDLGTQLLAERPVWVLALTMVAMVPLALPWPQRWRRSAAAPLVVPLVVPPPGPTSSSSSPVPAA